MTVAIPLPESLKAFIDRQLGLSRGAVARRPGGRRRHSADAGVVERTESRSAANCCKAQDAEAIVNWWSARAGSS